ncbi:cupin domain-containing protein [Reyranella sp.]|uniref:cupin domain-containing protein n=1 Tax=Reyranella sp. TaxID=1929291 RepID=UPI003BA94053
MQTFLLEDDGETPNNPILPLLVYRQVVSIGGLADPAAPFERLFSSHGWGDGWRNGIYPFLHFHTAAHEVLGIARGRATVEFGGARGRVLTVEAGDVVVLPAGTGHRRTAASDDLLVVGAYPRNGSFDQRRPGEIDAAAARDAIARVPLPEQDPVEGPAGPLTRLWAVGGGPKVR